MSSTQKIIYGKSGLINTGNTCYMNSAIQAFSHLNPLTHYFFSNEEEIIGIITENASKIFKNDPDFDQASSSIFIPDELKRKIHDPEYKKEMLTENEIGIVLNRSMTHQLLKLLRGLWKNNSTVLPTSFRKIFSIVRNKFFYRPDQHDAEEAYSCILQQMQEELGQTKPIKFITKKQSVDKFIKIKEDYAKRIENAASREEKQTIYQQYLEIKKEMPEENIIIESFRQMKPYYGSSSCKITELFTGFLQSTTSCPDCGLASHKFDPFLLLPLQLSNDNKFALNITNCLDEYCKECKLDDDNLFSCEKCKMKVKATKKLQIWTMPQILVIHLVRFRIVENPRWYTGMNIASKYASIKVNKLVEFPLENLDMSPYVASIQYDQSKCYQYTLQCIINQQGGVNAGHYFTYARDEETGKWFNYNDSYVTEISSRMIVSPQAYLLFYIRNDMFKKD